MSGLTNYLVPGGLDLSYIFQPLIVGGTQAPATNYKIASGADLSTLFMPWTTGQYAADTGYKVRNGLYTANKDLSTIFQYNILPPYTVTGTVTQTTDTIYNTILTWTSNGSITFYNSFFVDYTIIGGGAGGSAGISGGNGGNGGGNGTTINSSWVTTIIETPYAITYGSSVLAGVQGMLTQIFSVIANGGSLNGGGTGGVGGSPATNGFSSTTGGGGGGGGQGNGGAHTAGGSGGNGGGNGGIGGTIDEVGDGSPGFPGSNATGGGGGGGGGGARAFSGGNGGGGGSGTVVLRFNV